jgi:two-component system NtrC family sensor kinase
VRSAILFNSPIVSDASNLPGRDTLVALNRAATAARLLSGVVHDVNNSLQVISGTVELLASRTDLPAAIQPALERLGRQTARAASVLADVQRFTRASLSETGRVNLREVAEHSLALRAFAIKRASLTSRLHASETEHFHVTGNRAQLQQALLNLIMNAEQALAGHGGEILVELTGDATTVTIRVSDRGPGVSLHPVEQAFDAFVSTRDPWDGAGLGLWSVRTIAAEHGGEAIIETSPEGTSAMMKLPRAT